MKHTAGTSADGYHGCALGTSETAFANTSRIDLVSSARRSLPKAISKPAYGFCRRLTSPSNARHTRNENQSHRVQKDRRGSGSWMPVLQVLEQQLRRDQS